MLLSAFLKLDSAGFATGVGKAIESIKAVHNVASGLAGKLSGAFDVGADMHILAQRTGEVPAALAVMRRAFADTGVGADALGSALGAMRKSLGGVNEAGEPTGKIFQQLGLDVEALKGMGAQGQFEQIGRAIKGLKNPAEQTAAAMGIFRGNGQALLALFKSGDAFGNAKASLGEMPALLERNAAAFSDISTKMGHIKEKGQGLWAGVAEGLLPLADQVTALFDGLDLTAVGQRVGRFIGVVTQMFQSCGWGQMISLMWEVGWKEAVNYSVTALTELGNLIFRILSTPIAAVGTVFNQLIEGVMLGLSKIPKVNKILGLEGFEMTPIADAFENIRDDLKETFAFKGQKIELFDASDAKRQLADAFNAAIPVYEEKIAEVQRRANEAARQFGDASLADNAAVKGVKGGGAAITDALQRIGGSIGGNAVEARMESLTREGLGVSKSMLGVLNRIAAGGNPGDTMVWA